jgi:hypothetical protein
MVVRVLVGAGSTSDSFAAVGLAWAGELLRDPLQLVFEECGVREVPRRLSMVTRPTRRMVVWGAAAAVIGYEEGGVKWVCDIAELL